jgi:hypothetical protein
VEFKKKLCKNAQLSKPEELNGLDKITVYRDTFTVKNPMKSEVSQIGLEIKSGDIS